MEELVAQNETLRKQNKQMEADLKLAAEIGQQLLANNGDLTKQLEDTADDYTRRIEALEQENYNLERKHDRILQMSKHRDEELESVTRQLEAQKSEFEMKEQTEHLTTVNQLKKQVEQYRSEAEQAHLLKTQIEQKNKEAEETIETLKQDLEAKMNAFNETCSEEMAQLHSEITSLNNEKRELISLLRESKDQAERLNLTVTTLQNQLVAREAEVEEQKCEVTTYYNALESCREEVQELKVQLDLARMDSQNMKKKGNSLFAEVEDRRVEVEKMMISLKVKNETLKKQLSMERDTVHKLKLQMSALFHMSTGRADTRHVERLHEQLDQARSDVTALSTKLKQAEEALNLSGANVSWQELLKKHYDQNSTGMFSAVIETKEKELNTLRAELSSKRLEYMATTQQVIECQRLIYSLEHKVEKHIGTNMKLRVRIEELENKYEPEKLRRGQKMKLKAEKLPEIKPKEETENKENEEVPESKVPQYQPDQSKFHKEVITNLKVAPTVVEPPEINLAKLRPVSAGPILKDPTPIKAPKKVSISDEHDVVEIPHREEEVEGAPKASGRRVKGGKFVTGKVVKVNAPTAEQDENCKVQ